MDDEVVPDPAVLMEGVGVEASVFCRCRLLKSPLVACRAICGIAPIMERWTCEDGGESGPTLVV